MQQKKKPYLAIIASNVKWKHTEYEMYFINLNLPEISTLSAVFYEWFKTKLTKSSKI